ncbi:MAG: ATP-dependent helicase [Phycisphaerae bacterium]|nr:ATP-dependent helicase [Phycisphaerae bacterium]
MSHQTITIGDEDITYAESVLLHKGQHFDDERRRFIRNLETIDLQAVPGSGKTTALLAKLLILAKHLPFEDGAGILVLSHTNAAIDRIAEQIGPHCPRLFDYPNFVGTIQNFVDQFLAQPYAESYLNTRLGTIDTETYQNEIWRRFQIIQWDEDRGKPGGLLWPRHAEAAKRQAKSEDERGRIIREGIERDAKNMYLDFGDKAIGLFRDSKALLKESANPKYIALRHLFKDIVITEGIICYAYAYHLGSLYIEKAPQVKRLLQRRFPFVFVDEMQDMDREQCGILESIFRGEDLSGSIYQRIGDKNQAIFSQEISLDDIWTNREMVLTLKGSYRLSPAIANVVTPFATTDRIQIDGRNTSNINGMTNNIPPHVFVFDEDSKGRVIENFCELTKKFTKAGKIPKDHKYPFKAIAWRKGDDGKFGLKDYWNDYEAEAVRSKTHHAYLKSYLDFGRQEGWKADGLTNIHKKIMGGLLKVLRIEGIVNPDRKEGYISEKSLMKYLRETKAHACFYDKFKMKLFLWSRDIYQGHADEVYPHIKEFIPELLQLFGKQLDRASHFVNDESRREHLQDANASTPAKPRDNIYRCPATGIEVHVGTVHSVKGETHTATLYMESYYMKDGRGPKAKSFESQRLKDQFDGKCLPDAAGDRTKQSARMVYVGFSRPTHLLCFAVHKDRFDESKFRNNGWKVVYAFERANASGE